MIKFKCKDFLLKECEFEAKGTHSVDEMMKLVEVHAGEEHRTLKLQPETIEKIRSSLENSPFRNSRLSAYLHDGGAMCSWLFGFDA